MYANRTSVRKVMTIQISRVIPLCNFERLDILCPPFQTFVWKVVTIRILESFRCSISSVSIYYVPNSDIRVKSYDHSNFSSTSVVQFRVSRYIMSQIRTSVWKVMTIRISRELPMFNFEHLDELYPRIRHPSEKLWPFELLECFRCAISSFSINYVPNSNIRVKSYDHSNFSSTSVVQFRASRYSMSQIQTSVWKVMTIRISRELPLFNFEHLNILSTKFWHPCEKLRPFEFLEYFRCAISSL